MKPARFDRSHTQALAGALILAMVACGAPALRADVTAHAPRNYSDSPATKRSLIGMTAIGADCPTCNPIDTLNADNFSRPTRIEGPWLPLIPGTELVLQGVRNIGGGLNAHTVTFTVTNLVKKIAGVPCVVVWDRDVDSGDLRESELSFWAQDDFGNVWNPGEYPEEWEQGILIGAENTWIHGVENAQAGIHIQKRPVVSSGGYREAIAPENDFWDCGEVYARSKPQGFDDGDDNGDDDGHKDNDKDNGKHKGHDKGKGHDDSALLPPVCVPTGCYKDWVTVKEWAPLEGCDIIQLKTYAKGVGIVQVGALNDPEGETLTLVALNHLTPEQLAAADQGALELDNRGYTINEIYATTEHAYIAPPRTRHDDDDDRSQIASTQAAPLHTFMRIGPNPVSTSTDISFSVTQTGMVELAIYDVAGRQVRSLVKESRAAGAYLVQWNALDDGGRNVSPGVYFARLRTPAQALGKTVVVTN
jgi:hypothetical protein